jgi:hypothetical protein
MVPKSTSPIDQLGPAQACCCDVCDAPRDGHSDVTPLVRDNLMSQELELAAVR